MKSINVYDFFPIPDEETLDRFLKVDDEYEQRKQQFSSILLLAAAQKKEKLAHYVIKAIFSPEYIETHRWPSVK